MTPQTERRRPERRRIAGRDLDSASKFEAVAKAVSDDGRLGGERRIVRSLFFYRGLYAFGAEAMIGLLVRSKGE